MPTISQFYGIKITMNYNDHLPPHFHAEYQDYEVIVEISNGSVTGKMPRRALRMMVQILLLSIYLRLQSWL